MPLRTTWILSVLAVIMALAFVKVMFDMNANMARMTDYVGALSKDVGAMKENMQSMSADIGLMQESMQRMESHMQSMGSAVEQGGKMFQQWDPSKMMR